MDAALRGKVFLSPFILAVRKMNYASSVFPTAKTPPAARNTRLPGADLAGGGQEIGLELFSPKQVSVAPVSSSSLDEVIRAAKEACKGQAGSDPVPSVSQEGQLTAHEQPLSGKAHQCCNHAGLHASSCLPAAGAMPGGMTGENPFASVGAEQNLRGHQRQAAALADGLSPPSQGHVGAMTLAPTFPLVAAQQSPLAPLGAMQLQVDLGASASLRRQQDDLQQQIQVAELKLKVSQSKRKLHELEVLQCQEDEQSMLPPIGVQPDSAIPQLLTAGLPQPSVLPAVQPWERLENNLHGDITLLAIGDASGARLQQPLVAPALAAEASATVTPPGSQHSEPGWDQVKAAHNNELVGFAGVLSASKATVTTFDDRNFPTYEAIFAALKHLPAVAPWMLSCNPLTLIPPNDRVYCMEGLLLFPSRQDFIETPAQFASMGKPACVNILQTGALFAFLGNTVPQVGNVHTNILKLKVNEMRVKLALHSIDVAFVNAFVDISSASGIPVVRRYLPLELGILPLASAQKSKAVGDVSGRPVSAVPATFPLRASSAEIAAGEDAKKRSSRLASRGASCVTYNPSPQMAIALAVAGVAVSSVSADAPHSTGALLDSPGQPFGDSTYAVRQVARSMMAGTPCALATATDSPPPAQERCGRLLAVHGRCEGLAERRAQRAKANFEAAFADFIGAWPRQWLLHILGGADAAARTSPSAANMAVRLHCERHGGTAGVHLRTCLQLWNGDNGYVAYRRQGNLPLDLDYPIPPAEQVAFEAWRLRNSRAASGHTVVRSVRAQSVKAATYFGYPLDTNTALLCKAPKRVDIPGGATPADCPPDEVIFTMEVEAAVGVSPASEYAAALAVMAWSRARLEDFATARDLRLETMADQLMLVGVMDMKDGSVAAWWCIIAAGLTGEWPWLPRWVAAVNARGYMFARYSACKGDVFLATCYTCAEASLPLIRLAYAAMLRRTASRFQRVNLASMVKPTAHGPRHWIPVWAQLFMWSLPAREELGRWLGDMEYLLLPGEVRHTCRRGSKAICAVRYAADAARTVQARLAVDILRAIRSVLPRDEHVMQRIVGSAHYKLH